MTCRIIPQRVPFYSHNQSFPSRFRYWIT